MALYQLSYAGTDSDLPQERQRRHVPSQVLLSAGSQTEGHQRAGPGRVRLLDADERDAGGLEPLGERAERRLVGCGEHDGVGPRAQIPRAALAGGVNELRRLDSSGEVGAANDVVGRRKGERHSDRFSVAGS